MASKPVYLLDNTSAYLYNAFTQGQNVIVNNEKVLDKVTCGIILGEPKQLINNINVTVYPLYDNKKYGNNYKYNSNISALSNMLLTYIEPQGIAANIANYAMLRTCAKLQDAINSASFNANIYKVYLKLTSYLHLYCFSSKQEDLIPYVLGRQTNIVVDNYFNYTNKYICKKVAQATLIYSNVFKETIAIIEADSHMQLIAKSLATNYPVAIVHTGSFVMLCFNKTCTYRDEFTKLLTSKNDNQGDYTTFFLRGVEPDAIITAVSNII
jgi:hypothetical protein